MSRVLVILAAAALALGGSVGAAQTSGSRPLLRLTDSQPVKLSGQRFRSAERVRVTVVTGKTRSSRLVRATSAGAFVATFTELSADRCSGLSAVAVGGRGSRATFKLVPLGCPPPL
jgi:hypothetical protein